MENACSVIRNIMSEGLFEHVSAILASFLWDMAAIYLTLSCGAAGRVAGQWQERVKEELEWKLVHWEIPSSAHQCVHFIFHALAKLPNGSPARTWALLLESQDCFHCFSKYRGRILLFVVSWVFMVVHKHVWSHKTPSRWWVEFVMHILVASFLLLGRNAG